MRLYNKSDVNTRRFGPEEGSIIVEGPIEKYFELRQDIHDKLGIPDDGSPNNIHEECFDYEMAALHIIRMAGRH